ncbi:hypothetical protein JST56_07110 [Candidatus Dependentiae bacterium]|nr:hypothetical protein [Candidatus Dependentiae bacterium]
MEFNQIKSFEEACAALNISNALPDFSEAPDAMQAHLKAAYKLPIIIAAINNGWMPNWKNTDERKWMPWFYMNDENAEGGFSFAASSSTAPLPSSVPAFAS